MFQFFASNLEDTKQAEMDLKPTATAVKCARRVVFCFSSFFAVHPAFGITAWLCQVHVRYICGKCGSLVEIKPTDMIRCRECGRLRSIIKHQRLQRFCSRCFSTSASGASGTESSSKCVPASRCSIRPWLGRFVPGRAWLASRRLSALFVSSFICVEAV